ncbi:MAG: pentapeptide repeat-containing protein [Caldilineaceae bacterium]|nr:pentapeptide repeat-containing protein [Caldilineaceae bacterium]
MNRESSKTEPRTQENTKGKLSGRRTLRTHTPSHPQHVPESTFRHRPSRGSELPTAQVRELLQPSVDEAIPDIEIVPTSQLPQGHFREVSWPAVNLNGCDAHGADFRAADLSGICALGANFAGTLFETTDLSTSALCGANLTNANLRAANLYCANLSWCNLCGATLASADLRGANLAWADLRDVDLQGADLTGAYYNRHTQWPADFRPDQGQLIYLAEAR